MQSKRGARDTRHGGRRREKMLKNGAPGSPEKREKITPVLQTKFVLPTVTKALSTQIRGGIFKTKYHVSALLTHETREAAYSIRSLFVSHMLIEDLISSGFVWTGPENNTCYLKSI